MPVPCTPAHNSIAESRYAMYRFSMPVDRNLLLLRRLHRWQGSQRKADLQNQKSASQPGAGSWSGSSGIVSTDNASEKKQCQAAASLCKLGFPPGLPGFFRRCALNLRDGTQLPLPLGKLTSSVCRLQIQERPVAIQSYLIQGSSCE